MAGQMGDAFEKALAKEVDVYFQEVSLMRQLIKERRHPLELLRELVSNSAAREVDAKNIRIRCYPHPEDIYVFEVEDDGVGMDYSDGPAGQLPRLNRFLSLGLSAVVGAKSDEFSWKGLGSKLAFHSRRLTVETFTGSGPVRRVELNMPWETINAGRKPRPKIYESDPGPQQQRGTKILVAGHPPDVRREYTFSEIKDYLLHRTFVGYTRKRENPPTVHLAVGNNRETLEIGFPTLKKVVADAGPATRFVSLTDSAAIDGTTRKLNVTIRGLYSVEAGQYGLLTGESGNTGLILSVLGIPYFDLGLEKYTEGRRGLGLNPSARNCSLIVECDALQEEMNISRSAINDGAVRESFDRCVKRLLRDISDSEEYRNFVQYTKRTKDIRGAETLDARKRHLENPEQRWVHWKDANGTFRRLHREPEHELDTLAILWKLEAIGALPFHTFETLEHGGSGADIIAHFRESTESNSERFATVEAEFMFSNYKSHGHNPSQMPIVICWDLSKSRKIKLRDTNVAWRFIAETGDFSVRVYVLSRMPNVQTGRAKS